MNKRPHHDDLESAARAFLDAERQIDAPDGPAELAASEAARSEAVSETARSEEALFALFAALPDAAPVPGFATAVLQRSGLVRRDLGWGARLATAMAYALVLAGAVWVVPPAAGMLAQLELSAALKALVDAFTFLAARLGDLVMLGQRLAGFGRVLWLILASPPVVLASTLCAALTLLMGRWLAALLAVPRSSLHVAAR